VLLFSHRQVKAKTILEAQDSGSRDRHLVETAAATTSPLRNSSEISSAALPKACSAPGNGKPGTSLKPPLKWAGGKRWLMPYLAPLWHPHRERRYVEPFCGGLAAALGLSPKRALLNDLNPHLINFYRQLQHGLEITIEMENGEDSFYRHRSRFNELIKEGNWQSAEGSQLFYYLNRTCFNGLCRFNQGGEFNVPFGRHKSITYMTDFSHFRRVFKNWTFTNRDIELLEVESEDFIYADPPYDVEFTTYSAGGFSWEDQVRTAEWLAAHPGPIVLSNQATPRIVELYGKLDFKISYLDGPRRISCTGDRSAALEVLAVKGL
jgi:DNA adenine methylase